MGIPRTNTKRVTGGPSNDGLAVDSKLARPLRDRLGASCLRACQVAIVSAVVVLGLGVGPSTVAALIVPVVVDAVDGSSRAGPWSHVGIEGGEVEPAGAHRDSAATIVLELTVVGVAASVLHLRPRLVFWGLLHPVLAASLPARDSHLSPETSAALALPGIEHGCPDNTYASACTAHGPRGPREAGHRGPPTERIAYLNPVHGHAIVSFGTEGKG